MKVLLVPSGDPEAVSHAGYLKSRLVVAGVDCEVQPPGRHILSCDADELALVVPMGGDGTFLAAAHLLDFAPVPLLGLNYGHLAFLSGNPERDEVELVCDALAGDIPFERRATLDAEVVCADGSRIACTALNELAFTRGTSGHMVEYSYAVNGTTIAHVRADGLVAATATGSTAYALSAGGPIVSPGYGGLVVVPVSAHTINSRALVLAGSDVLELRLLGKYTAEASLFIDGQVRALPAEASSIVCRRGERDVLFARGGGEFFENVARLFFDDRG